MREIYFLVLYKMMNTTLIHLEYYNYVLKYNIHILGKFWRYFCFYFESFHQRRQWVFHDGRLLLFLKKSPNWRKLCVIHNIVRETKSFISESQRKFGRSKSSSYFKVCGIGTVGNKTHSLKQSWNCCWLYRNIFCWLDELKTLI